MSVRQGNTIISGGKPTYDDTAIVGQIDTLKKMIVSEALQNDGTLPTTGWTANTGDYAYKINYPINGIVSYDIVEVVIDSESINVANFCGLCPTIDSYDGGITFYCKTPPIEVINFSYSIRIKNQADKAEDISNPKVEISLIPITGWVSNTGDYSYKINIAISNITELDSVEITLDKDFIDIASDCNLCPTVITYNGGITFYAKAIPTEAIPFYYYKSIVGATKFMPFESSASNIKADGTASVGTLETVARADHIHPLVSDNTKLNISGGTMTGILTANSNTSYTTKQVRNIIISTADADLNAMANGDIWIKV